MGSRNKSRSVTRDATLDAFGTSQETDADADADKPNEPNEMDETGETDAGAHEVAVTADWTPAGARCAACGATVERRWQHQGRLVCPDCKDWRER